MEWNCCWSVNTVTPFLFESTGDSEEVIKPDVHHDHEEDDAGMDESEGVLFRFDYEDDVDVDVDVDVDDDDAQSCSYDHSSYVSTRCGDGQDDQSQRLVCDDEDGNMDDDGDGVIDVVDVVDDDDMKKNWGESKMMDSSNKQQKRSHKFCVDSLDQREIDRRFWEACLAT